MLAPWRREPYRLFFPLGLLLGWCGVLHWLLYGTGVLADYRPVFHAIAQVQGFLITRVHSPARRTRRRGQPAASVRITRT